MVLDNVVIISRENRENRENRDLVGIIPNRKMVYLFANSQHQDCSLVRPVLLANMYFCLCNLNPSLIAGVQKEQQHSSRQLPSPTVDNF